MTEAEWVACGDPEPMLEFLLGKASDRKLRLFGCACCRRIWHLLKDERSRGAVEVAERYADRQATREETVAASDRAADPTAPIKFCWEYLGDEDAQEAAEGAAGESVTWACEMASMSVFQTGKEDLAMAETRCQEEQGQAALLRDIFGTPFRPVAIDPAWLRWNGGGVTHLARAVYDERALPSGELDRGRLGILADALEDSGCTNADILGHLRGPGPHVRGCWAVDLLLQKA